PAGIGGCRAVPLHAVKSPYRLGKRTPFHAVREIRLRGGFVKNSGSQEHTEEGRASARPQRCEAALERVSAQGERPFRGAEAAQKRGPPAGARNPHGNFFTTRRRIDRRGARCTNAPARLSVTVRGKGLDEATDV